MRSVVLVLYSWSGGVGVVAPSGGAVHFVLCAVEDCSVPVEFEFPSGQSANVQKRDIYGEEVVLLYCDLRWVYFDCGVYRECGRHKRSDRA